MCVCEREREILKGESFSNSISCSLLFDSKDGFVYLCFFISASFLPEFIQLKVLKLSLLFCKGLCENGIEFT